MSSRARPSIESCDCVQADSSRSSMTSAGRFEPADLTAQLGADRAAGAGDQDPPAADVVGDDVGSMSAGWRPSRSAIVTGRMSDGATSPSSSLTGGSTSTADPGVGEGPRERLQLLARDVGDGDEHRTRPVVHRHPGRIGAAALHAQPVHCMRALCGSSSSSATGRSGLSRVRRSVRAIWTPACPAP